ncbi:MAG: glycosyltransferase family 4 protein [Phycisphaerae bacterium]
MRIALVSHQWPAVRPGGIGTYTSEVAAALAAAGHDVHVFTLPFGLAAPPAAPPGVTVHAVPGLAERVASGALSAEDAAALAGGEPAYRLTIARLLCDALRAVHARVGFGVVEFAEYEAHAWPLVADPPADLPIVVHLHQGTAISRRHNRAAATGDDALLDGLEFATLLAADGRTAPSQAVIRETESFGLTLPETAVIPQPVSPPAAVVPPPHDGPVLFLGRVQAIKGADRLAEALPAFLSACPDATIRIAGADTRTAPDGGSTREWIESRLEPAERTRVSFAGALPRAGIWRELASSSFVVLPSRFESFGYTAAEALAAGRAVVVPCGTALEELAGDAGATFDPQRTGDLAGALITLWRDRGRIAALGERGRRRAVARLSPDAVAARRVEFYRSLSPRRDAPRGARIAALPPNCAAALRLLLTHGFPPRRSDAPPSPGERVVRALGDAPMAFWLYGTGWHTHRLLGEVARWRARGHALLGFLDDDPARIGRRWFGLPVISPAALALGGEPDVGRAAVVLSSDSAESQLWSRSAALRAAGVRVMRLYGPDGEGSGVPATAGHSAVRPARKTAGCR